MKKSLTTIISTVIAVSMLGAPAIASAQGKSCQAHERSVTNIISRIIDRAEKQIMVFDKIASRTEAFYVKSGKTLSNYSTLTAAVSSAKSKAETDLAALKSSSTFNCSTSSPKGVVSGFQSKLKLVIADLKAYKTAVRNLIVGVKSVQGTTSSAEKKGAQQ